MKRIYNIVFYKYFEDFHERRRACIFYCDGTEEYVSYDKGLEALQIIVDQRRISPEELKGMLNKDTIYTMSKEDFDTFHASFVAPEFVRKEAARRDKSDEYYDEQGNYIPTESDPITPEPEPVPEKSSKFGAGVVVGAVGLAALIAISSGISSCVRESKTGEIKDSNLRASLTDINPDYEEAMKSNEVVLNGKDGDVVVTTVPSPEPQPEPQPSPVASTQPEETTTTVVNPENGLVYGDNDYYDDYTFEQLLEVTSNETQKRAMENLHEAITGYNGDFADAWVEEGKDIRAALSFDEVIALQVAYNDYSKQELRAIFNGAEIHADEMSRNYKVATLQLMGAHIIESSEHPVDMSMLLETEEGKAFYRKYHELFLAAKESTGDAQLEAVRRFYEAVRTDFPVTSDVRTNGISHGDPYASLEAYKLSVTPMIAASEMLFQNLEIDYTLNDEEIAFFNDIGLCNIADGTFKRIETITLSCCQEDDTNPLYEQYRDAIIRELVAKGQYVIDDAHRELSELDRFREVMEQFLDDGYWTFVGSVITITETHTETVTWTETTTETHTETTITEGEIPDEERERIDEEIEQENEEAREEAEAAADEEAARLQEEADEQAEQIHQEVQEDEEEFQEMIEDANEQINDPTNTDPVNESDFGDHNVDFYDDYEDGQGNLDPSVEQITTDPTGAVDHDAPLPDPEETGAAFDQEATYYANSVSSAQPRVAEVVPAAEPEPVSEPAPVADEPVYTEITDYSGTTQQVNNDTWIEIPSFSEPAAAPAPDPAPVVEARQADPAPSYEEAVASFVEGMGEIIEEEEPYEYSY